MFRRLTTFFGDFLGDNGTTKPNPQISSCRNHNPVFFFLIMTPLNWDSSPTGVSGSDYSSRVPEITPSVWLGSCCSLFSFLCIVFCVLTYLYVFFGVLSLFSNRVASLCQIMSFECPLDIFPAFFYRKNSILCAFVVLRWSNTSTMPQVIIVIKGTRIII